MTRLLAVRGIQAPTLTIILGLAWNFVAVLENIPFLQWGKQCEAGLTKQMLSVLGRSHLQTLKLTGSLSMSGTIVLTRAVQMQQLSNDKVAAPQMKRLHV